jgi:tetratricopeptide (TPR) repeat protein
MLRSILIPALLCASFLASAEDLGTTPYAGAPVREVSGVSSTDTGQIDLLMATIQAAEKGHAPAYTLAPLYHRLSSEFAKLGAYTQAEVALRHASVLLRKGPPQQLAQVLTELSVLDVAIGDVHKARKDQMQALRIRKELGDARELALVWNDVAELDIRLGKFSAALSYARKAMTVVALDLSVSAHDRIAVRQTLGFALCGAGEARDAVPVLKDAIQLAQTAYGSESLDSGVAEYALGYAYWQSGEPATAGMWMRQALAVMKANRDWGSGPYLRFLTQYAAFLRQQGNEQAALSAEREIRIADSIVDVSALKRSPR